MGTYEDDLEVNIGPNTLAASWSPAGVVQTPVNPVTTTPSSAVVNVNSVNVKGSTCTIDFSDELLQSPGVHGSCIRWLDRGKGVFKIEDSVRVARLWGKRKNRPAMNYDKLSRSIRQYYKKGIMKKTERSQRLVYQFCHPYCL
ncbi:hypothetical protein HZH66_012870 [Vespula vulgaris]|uniref:ETS domain-containing protein n=1 Tax=Vespula vulgaris TaxID=7454 RepID=A0A834MSE7_VESVU|nr:hypothetical protein HZH66_012870 [Vespula vulgaris]